MKLTVHPRSFATVSTADDFEIFLKRFPLDSGAEPDFNLLAPPAKGGQSQSQQPQTAGSTSSGGKPSAAAGGVKKLTGGKKAGSAPTSSGQQHQQPQSQPQQSTFAPGVCTANSRVSGVDGGFSGPLGLGQALHTPGNAGHVQHVPPPKDLLLHPDHGRTGHVALAQHHATIKVSKEQKASQKHRKEFEDFHATNGVRTVLGDIGPVKGVRMLLKAGYRHVYVSREVRCFFPFARTASFRRPPRLTSCLLSLRHLLVCPAQWLYPGWFVQFPSRSPLFQLRGC